ncbi:ATP-binding protein [Paraburkholderia caribensis]|uniref:histidine kinase n=1 Tax=Paraburkholderia caribensis TaxID=75105 RepID=A0A9Q6S620_9BURK|nr:ATP-binding protein [Paraburkholderia caribensis]MCO4877530.1 ATP-binding protein [Paraburkholderia caribensis]PTB26841.1 two-component system sensor histidine kinase/response regulator [Paraburkholderia caribensis]QLB65218.1 two-component system sensor histidine kinase/response regulator [Paraburkholderia caribensis]
MSDGIESARRAGVLRTDDLKDRPARAPDHAAEVRTLVTVAGAQTGRRDTLLQAIAGAALGACRAGSAGISLLETTSEGAAVFRWRAVAGACAAFEGKTTAWAECPCGMTLELGAPQLFVEPHTYFKSLRDAGAVITEGIITPIPIRCPKSKPLGAIWVASHGAHRFDREDVRLLGNLAVLAGAALTLLDAQQAAEAETEAAQQARRALEDAAHRRDEFIAMLGHELRNPMAPIDSSITALKLLCAGEEQATDVLAIAQRQMRQLRTLVDDLLDAARLRHGKLAIKYSRTSLNEIVYDAFTALKHHIDARKHRLVIEGLDQTVHVRADHVRLSQVVGNLLSNAAKYTPAGGTLQLRVQTDTESAADDAGAGGMVSIVIEDNGVGMSPEALEHVFELFAQSPSSARRSEGGLGIGLAVAKRLIELHDGTITLDSLGVGRGTRVVLRLPILDREPRAAHDATAAAASAAPSRILLVDDNADALDALHLVLELEGHDVIVARSGRDALKVAAQTLPEVGIIDIGMPEMDGFEVARAIRSNKALAHMFLIALTGYSSESDKSRALAAGFDYHLTKPVSMERLADVLSHRDGRNISGLV